MYCDWPVLGRCCFCLPLRRGVLTFGYINLVFSIFMMGVYSYSIHTEFGLLPVYHGTTAATDIPEAVCIAIYCMEIIFITALLYGTHMKRVVYIKTYYYFAITTTVASLLFQIIDLSELSYSRSGAPLILEVLPITLASMCIQIYLIILISSLLKKMAVSGPHVYENQLQQIVFEGKENNGVYDTTVVPVREV